MPSGCGHDVGCMHDGAGYVFFCPCTSLSLRRLLDCSVVFCPFFHALFFDLNVFHKTIVRNRFTLVESRRRLVRACWEPAPRGEFDGYTRHILQLRRRYERRWGACRAR